MSDADLCDNWEEFSEDTERLEKQLAKLNVVNQKSRISGESPSDEQPAIGSMPQFRILRRNQDPLPAATVGIPASTFLSSGIQLDSTSDDSLRTQFVPQLKILARPKPHAASDSLMVVKDKKQIKTKKSFEQREKEYSEARMRILGDVRFLEEEKEAELESIMTPAEILKMKVARAILADGMVNSQDGPGPEVPPEEPPPVVAEESTGVGSTKKNRRKGQRPQEPRPKTNPLQVHFPPSKQDSERILRQPRGPDGTTGFH